MADSNVSEDGDFLRFKERCEADTLVRRDAIQAVYKSHVREAGHTLLLYGGATIHVSATQEEILKHL